MRARGGQAIFGPYLLLEQIGQGGMAQVWRARRRGDETPLVLKTLHPHLAANPLFVELFESEACITAQLSHPGIVRLIDHGAAHGVPYLAMEQIDGFNVSTLMQMMPPGRRAPAGVSLAIGIGLCRALGHAHGWRGEDGLCHPIIHGDVTPSNVMVRRDGGLTLIDFGVARMGKRVAPERARFVIGKCGYLAPELLTGAQPDERSDVFSAGVVLCELLIGRRLFIGRNDHDTMRRVAQAPIPVPSSVNPEVSPGLDAVVLRALERDPARRFESGIEMALALEALDGPIRCSRAQVAAWLRTQVGRRPVDLEPATSPIAPALPARRAAPIRAAEPDPPREITATVCERPQAAKPGPPPVARALPRRRRAAPLLLAAAALVLTFLAPGPLGRIDWRRLLAEWPNLQLFASLWSDRAPSLDAPDEAQALETPPPLAPHPPAAPPRPTAPPRTPASHPRRRTRVATRARAISRWEHARP